jgi:hypothetical protein
MSAIAAEVYATTTRREAELGNRALKPEGSESLSYKTIVCCAERRKRELGKNKERNFPKQKKADKEPV